MKQILLMAILFMASPALAQTHCFGTYQVNGATNQAALGISGNPNVCNWGPLCYAIFDGGTKLGATGAVGANSWPPGVTVPQHWWEFANSLTEGAGNSSYDLMNQGSGNSYTADWANRANHALALNGSGWVSTKGNAVPDLAQLGNTFSVLLEADYPTTNAWRDVMGMVQSAPLKGWKMSLQGAAALHLFISADGTAETDYNLGWAPTAASKYQMIFVMDGGAGSFYVNDSLVSGPTAMITPYNTTGTYFQIGGGVTNISRVAVWIGHALTSTERTRLFNFWTAVDEANTFARRYAATPANMQVLNKGAFSALFPDTWGAEAAGKYGYSANTLRYHTGSTEPTISPGSWR